MYRMVVEPILLYANESWVATKSNISRVKSVHMRCPRRAAKQIWREQIKNETIRRVAAISR